MVSQRLADRHKVVLKIRDWLVSQVSNELGLSPTEIDISKDFPEYGLDKKISGGLIKKLSAWLGRSFTSSLLGKYPNIDILAWRLAESEPAAIIGMSCRVPGAVNIREFWELLMEGRDAITDASCRWDMNELYDPDRSKPGKMVSRRGGFLDDPEMFDASFFNISPREAHQVDPRQRIMLELAYECLENACIAPDSLRGSQTGVYIATSTQDYCSMLFTDLRRVDAYSSTGTSNSIVANRVSYSFDFHGPSISIDTACSGSLVAVEMAYRGLQRGDCDLALAGGVMLNLLPDISVFFSKTGALNEKGQCRTFDADANGIVRSEGFGVILMKPLSRAIADGDRIYSLIRGVAVNSDGNTEGIIQPSQEAQEEMLRQAYSDADIDSCHVQYIEAHGTGTKVGDPIEVAALRNVLRPGDSNDLPCSLGSVKTNIGHLESAAGIMGLIKAVLAVDNRIIPPTIHFKKNNPATPLDESSLFVQKQPGRWPLESQPLIAGISSFGFGGTNAHVVIEEPADNYPYLGDVEAKFHAPGTKTNGSFENGPYLFPLSARSKKSLYEMAKLFRRFLLEDHSHRSFSLADIGYTLANRRNHFEHRLTAIGDSQEELADSLQDFIEETPSASVTYGEVPQDGDSRLVFVYSGQGSHWLEMGQALLQKEPVFREALEQCEQILGKYVSWSLLEEITASGNSRLNDTDIAQPAVFAMQVALTTLWFSWGITPAAIIGHSLGEICAAYAAGVLNLEEAVKVVVHRSRLMKTVQGKGKTAVVNIPLEEARKFLENDRLVSAAGSNSPASCVISGDGRRLEELQDYFQEKDVFFRMVRGVDIAFHSPQMEPLKAELAGCLRGLDPKGAAIPLFSTVTGDMIEGTQLDADYWARNLRDPFLFSTAFEKLSAQGYGLFLEISPHPVLGTSIKQCLEHFGRKGEVLVSLHREKDNRRTLLITLAGLYASGYPIDWRKIYPFGSRCHGLPYYSWDRERYWYDQINSREILTGTPLFKRVFNEDDLAVKGSATHPLLGKHFCSALEKGRHFWIKSMSVDTPFYLSDHRVFGEVVFPFAVYIEMALSAAEQLFGAGEYVLEDIAFKKFLFIPEGSVKDVQVVFSLSSAREASWAIYSCPAGVTPQEESWTLHAEGQIRVDKEETSAAQSLGVDFEKVRERCTRVIDAARHYKKTGEQGLDYGDRFQGIRSVYLGKKEAIAEIRLPELLHEDLENYILHPVILDAASQPYLHYLKVLPIGIKKMHVYGNRGVNLLAYNRITSIDYDALKVEGEIQIINESGKVVMNAWGARGRGAGDGLQAEKAGFKNWLYELAWFPLDNKGGWSSEPGKSLDKTTWIIFSNQPEDVPGLRELIGKHGGNCVMVYKGENFLFSREEHCCYISPGEEEHYERLFETIAGGVSSEHYRVVFLWGLAGKTPAGLSLAALQALHDDGCAGIIRIVKALLRYKGDSLPRLWAVTRGTQYLRSVDTSAANISFSQGPLWGLVRTVASEHPELWGGIIDLDNKKPCEEASMLVDHIMETEGEKQVLFRNDKTYAARLVPWEMPVNEENKSFLRKDCAYLITGGLGGLGLLVARRLIKNGARRLILVGRSPFPPRQEWNPIIEEKRDRSQTILAIREMEAMGASIRIESLDVTDAVQLESFITRYRQEVRPEIRGVIHAAGVQREQLLMKFDTRTLNDVMGGKALGAWNLHRVFADQSLDFFVLFSSAVSFLGSMGLGDYAAANAFLDNLAHYRRACGLPAACINWGSWAEAGMAVPYLELHAQMGINAMNPETALNALEYIVQNNPPQVGVMDIDWKKWLEYNRIDSSLYMELSKQKPSVDSDSSKNKNSFLEELFLIDDAGQRLETAQDRIRKLVGEVMKTDPARLDPHRPLTVYGLDSIIALDLRNMVEKKIGIPFSLIELLKGISINDLARHVIDELFKELLENEEIEEVLSEVEEGGN